MARRATLGRILPKVRRGQLHPKPGRRFGCWRKFLVAEEAVWQGFGCGQPVWQVAAVAAVRAQVLKRQAVAPAELLATLPEKVASGGGHRPAKGPRTMPAQKASSDYRSTANAPTTECASGIGFQIYCIWNPL